MKSIVDNIQIFNDFVQGKLTKSEFEAKIDLYNYKTDDFLRDFMTTPVSVDEQTISALMSLLLQLNIPFDLWPAYFRQKLSLYDFLREIIKNQENSIQLQYILDAIFWKHFEFELELLEYVGIAGLVVIPAIGALVFYFFNSVYHFLFDTALILPILGIFFSLNLLFINLYLNHNNDRRPSFKIYRDDAFIITNSVLNISGKIVLMINPIAFSLLGSGFFILASVVELAKESWYLYELNEDYYKAKHPDTDDPVILQQHYVRLEHDYLRQRNQLIINLLGVIFLIGVLVACNFITVGFTLTLFTFVSIGLIYVLKTGAIKINDYFLSNQLQDELKVIVEQKSEQELDTQMIDQVATNIQKDIERPSLVDSMPISMDNSFFYKSKNQTPAELDLSTSFQFA